MKLLKPPWVHHDDKPIFSVDVHPEGLKFATGGQGNDCGRIVIWNLLPVLSEEAEYDPSVPKILCQMDNHLSCVNCVRWSQNGQMLASGSDDKLVMIWKMSKVSGGVFSTGGIIKNSENWKCVLTLRGHAGDVLDLAWSPQSRWLASGSVDNTIIIWDGQAFPTIIAVLRGHSGLVKGVTWDPVGKFLASQSDDRRVKIWKTSDWSCGRTITEPFEGCGGTTHVLRLSWSPDGQYLVSAHAMNGDGPTAQIIEREGWKCDKDFVGHRKAVTCARFHNSILKRLAPKTNKSQQYCCLAVGSRDRSLSVWMTILQRPLVVIHDLFQDSILDLSWGPDKYILLACSGDGTLACLLFNERELGTPLSEEDKNALYQRTYGKSATLDTARNMIIESAELLSSTHERIKPPTIIVAQTPKPIKPFGGVANESYQTNNLNITPVKAINKQIETITADGKRRITPMFIPLHQDSGNVAMTELNSSSRASTNSTIINQSQNIGKSALINMVENISNTEKIHLDNRLTKMPIQSAPARNASITNNLSQLSGLSNQSSDNKSNSVSINLSNLTRNNNANEMTKVISDYRVQIQNNKIQTSYGALSKVLCWMISKNNKVWEIFVGSPVVSFCICLKYVLLCSLDGSLRFVNIVTGVNVLPILKLPTAAIQCGFCPSSVLGGIISECGQLRIWNIAEQTVSIASSCADIFKSGQVIQFTITESGLPLVLLSNGNSYSYSRDMQSWLILNSNDPIISHGLQATIPKDFQKNTQIYPLMSMQTAIQGFGRKNHLDFNSSDWQTSAKLSFIENQIRICESVKSSEELKYWYSMLAYHLAGHGTECRIRLLLDDLLGSTQTNQSHGNNKILNIDKKSLFETILNVFRLDPRWQRIYMEYSEQLSMIESFIIKDVEMNAQE